LRLRNRFMKIRHKFLLACGTAAIFLATAARSQSSPSLGEVARQQRQQENAAQTTGDAPKVYTNADLPKASDSDAMVETTNTHKAPLPVPANQLRQSAERWRAQILAQKSQIAATQARVDQVNRSIHFANDCSMGRCVGWNARQARKQEQVESMQRQLEEQKEHLAQMQEAARRQGYGNSVYEP
jgi:hypothetical protein